MFFRFILKIGGKVDSRVSNRLVEDWLATGFPVHILVKDDVAFIFDKLREYFESNVEGFSRIYDIPCTFA